MSCLSVNLSAKDPAFLYKVEEVCKLTRSHKAEKLGIKTRNDELVEIYAAEERSR